MTIVGATCSPGGSSAAADERAAADTVIRTDASPVGPVEALGREQLDDPRSITRVGTGRQGDAEAVARPPEAGEVLGQLGRPAGADAERLEDAVAQLEAAVEDREVRAGGGLDPAVDPDVAPDRPGGGHPATSTAADRAERTARLGHRLVPLLGRVAPPGDPAADVEA